jgi:hypothetical protein
MASEEGAGMNNINRDLSRPVQAPGSRFRHVLRALRGAADGE